MHAKSSFILISFLLITFTNAQNTWYPFNQQYNTQPVYQVGYPNYHTFQAPYGNAQYHFGQQYVTYPRSSMNYTANTLNNFGVYNNYYPFKSSSGGHQYVKPFNLAAFDTYWKYYETLAQRLKDELREVNFKLQHATVNIGTYPFHSYPTFNSINFLPNSTDKTSNNQEITQTHREQYFPHGVEAESIPYTPKFVLSWPNLEPNEAITRDVEEITTRVPERSFGLASSFDTSDESATTTRRTKSSLFDFYRHRSYEEDDDEIKTEIPETTSSTESTTAQVSTNEATTTQATTTTTGVDENSIIVNEKDYISYKPQIVAFGEQDEDNENEEYEEYQEEDTDEFEEVAATTVKPRSLFNLF